MESIIKSRKHRILGKREQQLVLNWQAVHGGTDYVRARLWRAPNESDLSWEGMSALRQARGVVGRRDRAAVVNDAGRVAAKINQYLFSKRVERNGIDEAFEKDCTGTGKSISDFWQDVSEALTACQWLWIQVDRSAPVVDSETGRPVQRTLAERQAIGDRPRLSLWLPWEVADWCFDEQGNILWLITEEMRYENSNPMKEAKEIRVRTLWRRGDGGGATWETWKEGDRQVLLNGAISSPDVPFCLIGSPSLMPWWFDDAEGLQAQILNLDSLHFENLQSTVFPQLVISASTFENLETRLIERMGSDNGQRMIEVVKEVTRGLDAPIIENAGDKGVTRYIQPNAADLKSLPDEMSRKRALLFDTVGLSLFNKESRQIQTAESKQFDHLDTESTLRHRAIALQEAEEKVVALCRAIDTSFPEYSPVWPQEFSIVDTQADMAALVQASNISGLTLTMRKVILKAVMRVVGTIQRLTDDEIEAVSDEIDALEDTDFGGFSFSQIDTTASVEGEE